MNTLTNYAQGHLRMVEIDKRFEALIQRKKISEELKYRVRMARSEARWNRETFGSYMLYAEMALR